MKCINCGIDFEANTRKHTCSKKCEYEYKSKQQSKIYDGMSKPKKTADTSREYIAFAVFNILDGMKEGGKPKKNVSRNDIESKAISKYTDISKCESRFRKRCVTKSILNYGYIIDNRNKYDVWFKYIYNVKNKSNIII